MLGWVCVKALLYVIELSPYRERRPQHKQVPLMERGTDEFPSLVFVPPALYCKTEMILFPWQLCVNVLCTVFLHFMQRTCFVYHCLLSDWGYCTVSLLSISCVSAGRRWTPVRCRVEAFYCCAGLQTSTDGCEYNTYKVEDTPEVL